LLLLLTTAPARAQTPDGALGAAPAPAPSGPAVDVVSNFYKAFSTSDFSTMEQLYSPDVHWKDTIFSADNRSQLMGIWRFELNPSVGGKITYQITGADAPDAQGNTVVHVQWRDVYKFLGNPIDHSIDASLTVDKDGKIVNHVETYSWEQWADQAFPGVAKYVSVDNPIVKGVLEGVLRAAVAGAVTFQDVERAFSSKDDDAPSADAGTPEGPRTGITKLVERDVIEKGAEDR
jgi:ketosteroid isomerase-like protein